jgi:hypothetical protein
MNAVVNLLDFFSDILTFPSWIRWKALTMAIQAKNKYGLPLFSAGLNI